MTIDDYLEATQVYLPPSRLAGILQEHCNYQLMMKDWDQIYAKHNNYMDRLKELDDNFRKGKYTIGLSNDNKNNKKKKGKGRRKRK